jgi:hypothetical protein
MAIKLSIEARGTYLHFDVSGERERDQLVDVWAAVARELQTLQLHLVLGVSKLTGQVSTTDTYRLASGVADVLLKAGCEKLACVITDKAALQSNVFAETVGVNRGLQVRMFATEDAAIAWLTS